MAKTRELTGHLMALGAILIYSFNTNFMKVIMPVHIQPEGLVLLRCAFGAIGFWIIGLFIPPQTSPKPGKKDILMMMLGGVLGMGANLLLYLRGLSMTGPVDVFVIRTVQPIIVILLSVIFLHVTFTKYKAIGILLGLAGTVYVSIMPHEGAIHDSFGGDMLVFLSSVSYAFYLILIKPYTVKFNSLYVMKWMTLAAFITSFPFGIRQLVQAPLFHEPTATYIWLEIGYILIFATLVGYFLNLKALHYIAPFVESAYIYLLPITGAAVSIGMGLQKFSWHDPIALALIVSGFILINLKKKGKKRASGSPVLTPAAATGADSPNSSME